MARFVKRDGERAGAWRRLLATALVCAAAVAAIALPGTARAWDYNAAYRCTNSEPISTATHHRVFSGQFLVGRNTAQPSEYGYTSSGLGSFPGAESFPDSILGPLVFVYFPRPPGVYDEMLPQRYTIIEIVNDSGSGEVTVTLSQLLTAADRRGLSIKLCDRTFKFAEATENTLRKSYTWSGTGLDWSDLTYGGRPVRDPVQDVRHYGVVSVSVGVEKALAAPRVTRARVNGTSLTLTFDKTLDSTEMPGNDDFSVGVRQVSQIPSVPDFVTPVPTYTQTRTVTAVTISGNTAMLTLNAAPPQFAGNFKPGLLLTYPLNTFIGTNGTGVHSVTNHFVGDNTPNGGGTLVVMNQMEGTPPAITGAPALSALPEDGNWSPGDTVEVTLTFTEAVAVDATNGTPSVTLRLGGSTAKSAGYLRGSGTTALVFGYTLTDDDGSHDSMLLDGDSLALNGGTIRGRTSGLDALLDHDGAASAAPPPAEKKSPQGSESEAEGATVTTAEDTAYTFQPSDFGFSDDAKRDRESSITIATLPGAGALTVDGRAASQHQVVDKTDVGTGALVFTPAANAHGDAYASFDFRTYNGRTQSAAATMTIDVTPVNDDPAGAPGIAGEVEVGQTATATTGGLSDPDGLTEPGWSYRWLRVADGVETAIDGATGSSYVLAAADAGHRIKVEVAYTDDDGTPETVTSAAWPPEGSIAAAPQIGESNADDSGGVTAAFRTAPATHNGAAEFTVELHFSAEPPLSFRTVQGSLLETTNATIRGARRLTPGSNLGWEIRVRPDAAGDVTLTLPVRPCSAANAICVDGAALGAAATATIAYAAPPVTQTPLTASFTGMPAGHNGGAFTFELALSEDVRGLGYERVRDSALTVSGGTVTGARRLVRGSNQRWEVRVTPSGLGNVTVALAATQSCSASGAICTPEGKKQSTSRSATVRGPALSVADASVEEDSGAELAFAVTLAHAAGRSVSVAYATSDGTATSGSDYTATSGRLVFAAGETSKTISVSVLDDAHDEGSETLTLTLSNPSPASVSLADATATGTIKNTDPLQRAWLSRFGRTVGTHVTDAIGERLRTSPDHGSSLTIGGTQVPLTSRTKPDEQEASPLLRGVAQMLGLGGGSAASTAETDPRLNQGQSPDIDLRSLLLGSAFRLQMNPSGAALPSLTAWGRFAGTRFAGRDGALDLDGDVFTGTVGIDGTWDRAIAGLAVAHSRGEGDFAMAGTGDRGRGDLEQTMTSVHPYLRYAVTDRLDVWGVLGYGRGELEMDMANGLTIETDSTMLMGSVGGRGILLEAAEHEGFQLATRTDVMLTRTESEAVAEMVAGDGSANRLRLILEGSRGLTWEDGRSFTPTVELGVRHDWGDAETGFGLEVGGRVQYADPRLGLTVEAAVRGLVAHEDDAYDEWGASGTVRLAPGVAGQGLSLTLAPAWGATASGVDGLWSRQTTQGLAPPTRGRTPGGRLAADVGYGVALFDTGLLTPYAGTVLADGADRTYRVGTRWTVTGGRAMGLQVSLDGLRQEPRGSQPVNQGVRLQVGWGF